MAGKKKEVNLEQLELLAQMQCSGEEIAAVLGLSHREFERRRTGKHPADKKFAEVLANGRQKGKASIRRIQYEQAKNGSTGMSIWLGKIYLDQREPEPAANLDTQNFLWQLMEQAKQGPARKVQNCETCRKPMGECTCESGS
jgi:hypothetical protein